ETATETLPTYSTRLGEQSVGIIVSIVVVPITARPFIPGSNHAGNCPTPPDGTLVSVEAIPLGVTGAPNLSGVGTLFSTIISPRVVIGLVNPPPEPTIRIAPRASINLRLLITVSSQNVPGAIATSVSL